MPIFSGLSTPQWQSPQKWLDYNEEMTGKQLQAAEFAINRNDDQQQQQRQLQIAQQTANKLGEIGTQLKDSPTPEAAWQKVSENPQWMVDPQTAPFVGNYMKSQIAVTAAQTAATKAQSGTVSAKLATDDGRNFITQIAKIAPEDRAAIQSMSKNKDGTPSAMQWQALSLAQQTMAQRDENSKTQAEIDAANRGDVATTTVGPKGVSTTYRPPKDTNSTATTEPQLKTFPDGTSVIYNPKGGGFHIMQSNGQTKPMSTSEMTKLYTTAGIDQDWKDALGTQLKSRSGVAAKPAPSAPGVRVKIKNSSGQIGTIPASQLQDALKSGYSQVQDGSN